MNVQVPYGKRSLSFEIPDKNFLGVLRGKTPSPIPNLPEAIRSVLRHPVGCRPLAEEVRGKKNICIVVTDITRPNCYPQLLPILLEELAAGGILPTQITILVATGLHRPNTTSELEQMFGAELVSRVKMVNHRADCKEELSYLGQTSQGCPIWVNRELTKADYVICTGVLEPHFWAGFSGGRKVIGIGCAGDETIRFLHSPQIFEQETVRMGSIEKNYFHEVLTEIALQAGARFMINFILNEEKQVCFMIGGEIQKAFEHGVELAQQVYQVEIAQQAEIAVAGVGYPKSTNLYQGTRGASCIAFSPYPAVKKGGMVITPLPAEEGAGKGVGEERFRALLAEAESIPGFIQHCLSHGYPAGAQRAFLLALTMRYCEVVVVGTVDPRVAEELKLTVSPTLESALEYGYQKYGPEAKVFVIPDGARLFSVSRTEGGDIERGSV